MKVLGSSMVKTSRIVVFLVFFLPLCCESLQVRGIRTGYHKGEGGMPDHTRVVFDTDKNHHFDSQLQNNQLKVSLPKGVKWLPSKQKLFNGGHVEGYQVKKDHVVMNLKPNTVVHKKFLIDGKNAEGSRFVFDMQTKEGLKKAPTPKVAEVIEDKSTGDVKIIERKKETTFELIEPKAKEKPDAIIERIDIRATPRETFLSIATRYPELFEAYQVGNLVYISLPKTDWYQVKTRQNKGGFIRGYYIDQSTPGKTSLVLSLEENKKLLSRDTIPGPIKNSALFVLTIVPANPEDIPMDNDHTHSADLKEDSAKILAVEAPIIQTNYFETT